MNTKQTPNSSYKILANLQGEDRREAIWTIHERARDLSFLRENLHTCVVWNERTGRLYVFYIDHPQSIQRELTFAKNLIEGKLVCVFRNGTRVVNDELKPEIQP